MRKATIEKYEPLNFKNLLMLRLERDKYFRRRLGDLLFGRGQRRYGPGTTYGPTRHQPLRSASTNPTTARCLRILEEL